MTDATNPTTRDDIELYVTGNYDGDIAALEHAVAHDPALAAILADEARLELLLRDAASSATFCVECSDLVRADRCDSCGAAVRPGGYTVERVLISNAHGRMYVAHDADGKQVALKELAFVHAPSAGAIAAFEREATFLRALEHPAIPRFVASFDEGRGVHTRYYLAQELVVGTSLDRLDAHWYREDEIVALAKQVLEILVYLQSLSPMVVHRDIKPANLLKRADGTIALVDFGAAYVQGSTAGSTTVGTFGYMPIEQLAGIVDATTDVFALGASLLHLLTRQEPWKLAQGDITINVSAPLRAFLDKMIAHDSRARFATAKDALAALERRDELVVAPGATRRPRKYLPLVAIASAVAFAGAGIGASVLIAGRSHSTAPATPPPPPAKSARIRISVPDSHQRDLELDGKSIAKVTTGYELMVPAGHHRLVLIGPGDRRCEQELELMPDVTVEMDCGAEIAKFNRLPHTNVDVGGGGASIHALMRVIADQCGVGLVIPDSIDAKIDVMLSKVPCDTAVEAVLEPHGLWYRYDAEAKLMRVGGRKQLEADDAAEHARTSQRGAHWIADDVLPGGGEVDVDMVALPLRAAVTLLAKSAGVPINIVIPDQIGTAAVTIRAKGMPWNKALQAVLASQGLWYRYREGGHLLMVEPRKELDAEDEARSRAN